MKKAVGAGGALLVATAGGLGSLVLLVGAAGGSSGSGTTGGPGVGAGISAAVPAAFAPWVGKAGAMCPQFPPAIIAAQLDAESGFSTTAVSPAGAQGPAQFMPGTWATWGRDDDLNGTVSPFEIGDAVMAQGRYDCALAAQVRSLAGDNTALALAAYNAGPGAVIAAGGIPPIPETQAYVPRIMALAAKYAAAPPVITGQVPGTAGAVIAAADSQLRVPYAWVGGGPTGPSLGFAQGAGTVGFDCSSLVQYAFAQGAGLMLPRVADAQARGGVGVTKAQIQPGDVVAFGSGGTYDHVGIYIGNGQMINAPKTGDVVSTTTIVGNSYWEAQTWAIRRYL